MLSISAPSKFALTLQSVPPFFLESVLAFVLVILLAIPLIARVQMLLENPMNYFPPLPRQLPPTGNSPPSTPTPPPTPVISVNLQLDTIRPITSLSSIPQEPINLDMQLIHPLTPFITEKSHKLQNALQNTSPAYDYEFYRHNYIELNLKKQFGERIPGNVVLNAHHLSTIDSKILLKLNRKFQDDLFDFIEYPESPKSSTITSKKSLHPTDHFLPKNLSKDHINLDKSIETIDPASEIDQVPELIDFKNGTPTPTSSRSPRRRRQLAESADNVQKIQKLKNSKKKLESTASLPMKPQTPLNQLSVNDDPPKLSRTMAQRQVDTPKRPNSLKPVRQKPVKTEENLDVKKLKDIGDRNERSSITCPSVASSEAFSLNSSSSKQPERIVSRPTSSCGSTRGFKNFRSRVNSRPRSGGYFGWDIPDSPEAVDSPLSIPTAPSLDDVDIHDDKEVKIIEDSPKLGLNLLEKKERPDKLMSQTSPKLQSAPDTVSDVTAGKDQFSSALNARNVEDKMHKSRLPVRQTEASRKMYKKNSFIDKSGRELRKKEDVALQVSASVIKSGIDDNLRNSFRERMDGVDEGECNQEASMERTMRGGISKEKIEGGAVKRTEINTSNQQDQVKSLIEGGEDEGERWEGGSVGEDGGREN